MDFLHLSGISVDEAAMAEMANGLDHISDVSEAASLRAFWSEAGRFHYCRGQFPKLFVTQLAALLVGLTATLFTGCQKNDNANSGESKTAWQAESQQGAGPSAPEIVNHVRQAYATANSYQDQATLHLSYQLQGSYLEEPNAWAVSFDRNAGLQSNIYDARIKANDKQMSCFIFDFGSGNLDDQWQIHPRNVDGSIPIGRLFQDGICRHYLTGQDEVPIDTTNSLASEMFFPPTIGWLVNRNGNEDKNEDKNQTRRLTNDWLSGNATRLPDEQVDGRDCFQLTIQYQQMTWTIHVDQEDFLVRQIRYPNELLDQRLQNNPDVQHLEVVARFKQATWQPSFSTDTFRLKIPADAKQVSQFVAVPEEFPSHHIGKRVAELGLRNSADQLLEQSDWKGKVSLLCWTGHQSGSPKDSNLLSVLESVASQLDIKQYNISRVEVIEGALPGNPQVAAQLKRISQDSRVPVLADYGFNAGRALGVKQFPVLAIVDREGVLQYVKLLPDDPTNANDTIEPTELANVLVRVRSGDDVAKEMRREYESFLDLYRERLAAVSLQTDAGRDDGKLADTNLPTHVQVQELWTNDTVQQPGNLHFHKSGTAGSSPSFTLLDGWRTVIQLDENGSEQNRKELDLGTRESISMVRTGDRQPELNVVFSVMGRTVRVLDRDLKTRHSISVANEQQRVRDANLFDFDNDGQDELIVSFTGPRGTEIVEIDSQNNSQADTPTRQISGHSFRSSTVIRKSDGGKSLIYCDSGGTLRRMESGSNEPVDVESDLVAATRVVSKVDAQDIVTICAIGTNRQGHWTAVGFDETLKQVWAVPIGNQRFETQIESIAYSPIPGSRVGIWAIAAADGSIKLIRDDGKLVDNWNLGIPIHGIELLSQGQKNVMVLSTDDSVQAWSLSSGSGKFLPASSSR